MDDIKDNKYNFRLLSHRGVWKQTTDQNTIQSFILSLDNCWGIETDLRVEKGEIVVSHDLPKGSELTFREFLQTLSTHKNFKNVYYALNIKEDGFQNMLIELLEEFKISNRCFVFDMSGPDQILFERKRKSCDTKLMLCTRLSEYEKPILYEKSEVVWMDAFESSWIEEGDILKHLNCGKMVAMVSPELHERKDHLKKWTIYKKLILQGKNLLVCTDYPFKFMDFMKGE